MKLDELPSCGLTAPTVLVGRDRRGNWIACEQNGIFGGLFANRAQAFKYALHENGHHPETMVELSHEIELAISANPEVAGTKRVASSFSRATTHAPSASCHRKGRSRQDRP